MSGGAGHFRALDLWDDQAAARSGFGLLGMQERASLVGATLQLESAPGKGTTILVRMAASAAGDLVQHG